MHFIDTFFLAGPWIAPAHLVDFGHALGVSFEANLAYSAVIRLGNFSGKTIDDWVDAEKLRVIPALSETDKFDVDKFNRELDKIRRDFRGITRGWNFITVTWAVTAACIAAAILFLTPFHPQAAIDFPSMWVGVVLLALPVPVGIAGAFTLHRLARRQMRDHSREFDGVIKYSQTSPGDKVDQARAELRKILAAEKGEARVGGE